jgi:hypothetical protein
MRLRPMQTRVPLFSLEKKPHGAKASKLTPD